MAVEEWLAHPFVLLVTGAVITSIFIPWFTRRNEDHKKKIEIKSKIVSRMGIVVAEALSNELVVRSQQGGVGGASVNSLENQKGWYKKVNLSRAEIVSYFPNTILIDSWLDYLRILEHYWECCYSFFKKDESFSYHIDEIKDYFLMIDRSKVKMEWDSIDAIDWDGLKTDDALEEWASVTYFLLRIGDSLMESVIRERITVF